MQNDVARLANLRRDIQGYPREEGFKVAVGIHHVASALSAEGSGIGSRQIIGLLPYFEDGLLIVEREDAGARNHLHVSLRLEQLNHAGEIREI